MLERRRPGIRRAVNRRITAVQQAFHVIPEVVVPETYDAIARRLEPSRARFVACEIFADTVVRAIQFDDEMGGHAGEIDDIWPDGSLSAEVRSFYRPMPQVP